MFIISEYSKQSLRQDKTLLEIQIKCKKLKWQNFVFVCFILVVFSLKYVEKTPCQGEGVVN
jgi:uncharacterized membrane protein YobD (UPF0266 family)